MYPHAPHSARPSRGEISAPQRGQWRQSSKSPIDRQYVPSMPIREHEFSRVGLLAELPGQTLRTLSDRMVRESIPAGGEIVREGDAADRFYVVLSGMLAVTQEARGERRVLKPGDYFGEVALTMDVQRTASIRALTPSVVASCDRETFDEFVRPLFSD